MAVKPFTFRLVICALLAASLACNAITNLGSGGGRDEAEAALATAEAVQTQAAVLDAAPTRTPVVTSGADDPTGTPDSARFDSAPPDVPIYDNDTVEDFIGSTDGVSYFLDEEHATVVEFYQEEMPANGWSAVPGISLNVPDLAILTFERPGRTAIVTISIDPISGRLAVLVAITLN